jgi:alpha-amylase
MKQKLFAFAVCILAFSTIFCQTKSTSNEKFSLIDGHPSWIMKGNIYEVNTRQYTKEGTFAAFAKHLERLKEMGVQTLWFMPINPISVKDRKGSLGSYYAVANYKAINPEHGNLQDWKNLVKKAHSMGFKIIIDWVPTHSGADNKWLETHKDFYVLDKVTNEPVSQYDWTDTRKLNYSNAEMVDSMIASMKFWITETDIDGFRCDVAGEVPDAFWTKCIAELKKIKNIFMLAEGDKPSLHKSGFDATYTWEDFSMMKLIAKGERPAMALDSIINKHDTMFAKNAMRLYFTSNHDENTWNKADYATMPGAVHAPFAVITQTIKRTIPLVYSGQEEPYLDSLSFFYKDLITFKNYSRAGFYKTLLNLRTRNSALMASAKYTKLASNNDNLAFAYLRSNGKNKVLVVTNLSATELKVSLKNNNLKGMATNVFTKETSNLFANFSATLPAWGFLVYEYK